MHIDTGHNFPGADRFPRPPGIRAGREADRAHRGGRAQQGIARAVPGESSRNRLQTPTLLAALEEFKFDCAIGGARRDEEKARAKERVFSFRDAFGQWDPKNQRPELWNLYNARINPGEHMRVFPLSNWTELDVWQYIDKEKLDIPSIYFTHPREVVRRDGQWLPVSPLLQPKPREEVKTLGVRVRTIGDITCTGCVESPAANVPQIIEEIAAAKVTERGSRADDKRSDTPWKTANAKAISNPWTPDTLKPDTLFPSCLLTISTTNPTSSASPPPAAWTTARAPSSGACSTTPSSSSRTAGKPPALGRHHRRGHHQPGQPDRRPARGARAGHHH
jgi:sulfate adenylyltransferase subunit 2